MSVHAMNDEPGWMVARVHEDDLTVFERIRDEGFQAFSPAIWVQEGRHRKARPLYPRYIFVRQAPSWARLHRIDGVSYILGGEEPGIVPHAFVWQLKTAMDLHGGAIMPEYVERAPFRPGDGVRITTGPWAGLIGRFQARQAGRGRLLLDFLGGERTISLPLHHLAPLASASSAA